MVSPHLEKILFHNIINNDHYMEVVSPRFFEDPILKNLYKPVKEFWEKYREAPTKAQVEELIKINDLSSKISSSQLDTLWKCNLEEYETDWLTTHTETFIEYKNLGSSVEDLVNYLKTTPVNIENIKDVVDNAKRLVVDRNNIDFNFEEGSDFFNPVAHKQPTYNTFSSGYDYIDKVADGGFSAKTLTVFLGAPKVGKCFSSTEYIHIRNKKTGVTEKIKISDFHDRYIRKI